MTEPTPPGSGGQPPERPGGGLLRPGTALGLAGVLAVLVALAVVMGRPPGPRSPGGSGTAPTTVEGQVDQPPGDLKPVLRGLLDRDGPPPDQYLGAVVRGFVVQARWADLQPRPGGEIVADNDIDRAVARVRQLTARAPGAGLGLKLRVYAGVHAPEWAKSTGGAPVQVTNPQNGEGGTVGRFWTDEFGRAYEELQRKLAARYDGVPEIREVVISRCTTFFAEPFLRNKGDRPSVANLMAAGFTTPADHGCHRGQVDAHRVWTRTRSNLQLNPYQDIEQRGVDSVDEAFTEEMMQYCRRVLGLRCVLENNSVSVPPKYERMYRAMRAMGPPLAFQTATARKIGDLHEALDWAARQGAASVELPASYVREPPESLARVSDTLARNPG